MQSGLPEDNPFDLAKIRQLVRLMRDNELAEIDLRWKDSRVRIRRGQDAAAAPIVSTTPSTPSPPRPGPFTSTPEETPKSPSSDLLTITSPIVGTFYASPGPDVGPFVAVGSKVMPETTVCIIEAMKVFNEIPAGVSGTIREVLVENGAPVEYGQALFRVEP